MKNSISTCFLLLPLLAATVSSSSSDSIFVEVSEVVSSNGSCDAAFASSEDKLKACRWDGEYLTTCHVSKWVTATTSVNHLFHFQVSSTVQGSRSSTLSWCVPALLHTELGERDAGIRQRRYCRGHRGLQPTQHSACVGLWHPLCHRHQPHVRHGSHGAALHDKVVLH